MTEQIHALLDLHRRPESAAAPVPRTVIGRRLRGIGWGMLLLLAAGSATTMAMRRTHAIAQRSTMAEQARRYVHVATATNGGASVAVDLPGTLQGFTEAPISARTSGYVVGLHADIGSKVRKGDRLAEISSPEADQQLAQSLAARVQLDAGANLAKSSLERWQTLRGAGAVSQQAIDERRSTVEQAAASLAAADANIARLRQLQAFKHVVAPFDGVITRRNVGIGDLIDAGGSGRALFVLTQTRPLRVNVFVPQAYAMQVREGGGVVLTQPELPGQTFAGKIVRTGQALDPASRSLQTEIVLPNEDERLMAGAYVSVRLQLALPAALEVPANTLLFRPEGPRIAVVAAGGVVRLHPVRIGKDFGQSVQILAGIDQRDSLVLNPADSLTDGDAVTVVAAPSTAPQPR